MVVKSRLRSGRQRLTAVKYCMVQSQSIKILLQDDGLPFYSRLINSVPGQSILLKKSYLEREWEKRQQWLPSPWQFFSKSPTRDLRDFFWNGEKHVGTCKMATERLQQIADLQCTFKYFRWGLFLWTSTKVWVMARFLPVKSFLTGGPPEVSLHQGWTRSTV